jgi:crotonobetainyl-CoA:carnitine CoA-transferase CaiB-like acyl-CoA transferase
MTNVALTLPPLLADVSVLDLSIWRPGPYATSLLVGLGADVVKVEPPGGDPMRHYPELFESVNAGKRSIMLDLKDATGQDGRARALELAAAADVVVEGFRPGVMARLGLDEQAVRALNPGVVYCSISGYGQEGPLALVPGHDLNYQAWAGSLAPDGGTAAMPPLPLADLASGLTAAFGICAALLGRRAGGGGSGSYLDISMTDVMATWTGTARSVSDQDAGSGSSEGENAPGRADPALSPNVPGYGLFDTLDGGQVALGVVNEQHFWSALCAHLGLAGLGGLTFGERLARGDELTGAVADAIGSRRRDELVSELMAVGVPAAPVLDRADMTAAAPFPAFPIRMGNSSGRAPPPAPALDRHRGEGFHRAR